MIRGTQTYGTRWLVFAAVVASLAACGRDGRSSAEGETCSRTADCADPLRCVEGACLTPARARHLIDARRGPAVPEGAAVTTDGPLGQGLAAPQPATPPAPSSGDAPGGGPDRP